MSRAVPHDIFISSLKHFSLKFRATNIDLLVGLPIIAQAEDSQQRIIPLTVEYAGMVPGNNWLIQINVKLPSELRGDDRVWIRVIVNGVPSNEVLILLKP